MAQRMELDAKPNWKQLGIFVGLTFCLTYLLDLILYLTVGYGSNAGTVFLLQVQMLIPATVALVLQIFLFKDSPIHRLRELSRWFFYVYLIYILSHLTLAISFMLIPSEIYQSGRSWSAPC